MTVGRGDTRQGPWLPVGLEGFQAPDSSPYSYERKRISQTQQKMATHGCVNAPGICLDFGRVGSRRRHEKAARSAAAGQSFGHWCSSVPDEGAWLAGAHEGGGPRMNTPCAPPTSGSAPGEPGPPPHFLERARRLHCTAEQSPVVVEPAV